MKWNFVSVGSLLAAMGVGLGALGAHALKSQLTAQQLETFHTAVQYQMYHAIGLVLVGLLNLHQRRRLLNLSGWAMLMGILLFSGCLFVWVLTGQRLFVYPVPVGGIAFILGWLLLALGALGIRQKEQKTNPPG